MAKALRSVLKLCNDAALVHVYH